MEQKTAKKTHGRRAWIRAGIIAGTILIIAGIAIFWRFTSGSISIDKAQISAPLIELAPSVAGKLQAVYVNEGDEIAANTPVALVGNALVKSKVPGVVVTVPNTIGSLVSVGQAVVEMIDPRELRVVGKIDENKGLSRIAVGDTATFTIDAFGGKAYSGIIDEISPTSVQSGIIFNISDQRSIQQFEVKVRFDQGAYPELKNGMSAKIKIFPQ